MRAWLRKLFSAPPAREPRRSPRIRLLLSDVARFETDDGVFPLLNLSESGLGLLAENGLEGERLSGRLYLGAETVPVEIQVVRRDGAKIGARFLGDASSVRGALRRQFTEELEATGMTEVAQPGGVEDGTPHWYYAPGNYELFYLEEDKKITRLEMGWGERVLRAKAGEGLRGGRVPAEAREKPGHARSDLVQWEREVPAVDRTKAVRIVENIPGLAVEVRRTLVEMLRSAD